MSELRVDRGVSRSLHLLNPNRESTMTGEQVRMSAGRLALGESDQKRSDPRGIAPLVSEMGSNPCGSPHGSEFQLRACYDGLNSLPALATELDEKLVVHDRIGCVFEFVALGNLSSIDVPNAGCDGFDNRSGLPAQLIQKLVVHILILVGFYESLAKLRLAHRDATKMPMSFLADFLSLLQSKFDSMTKIV